MESSVNRLTARAGLISGGGWMMGENNKRLFTCFGEEEYAEQMQTTVEPMLAQIRQSGTISVNGGELYYELYPKAGADTVVISHGFSESAEKFAEFIYYLYQAGYQVAIWEHRGHGRSLREGKHADIIYVEDFQNYVEDMHLLMEERFKAFAGDGRLYLFAHSMGGCVGALYLETYPGDFRKAVLNAPMLAIEMGPCPLFLAQAICKVAKLFGGKKERLFTHGEFDPQEPFSVSCTDSEARHLYYLEKRRDNPAFRTSSASYNWADNAIRAGKRAVKKENASRIQIPVLLIQAGKDNQVKPKAQQKFADTIAQNCRLVPFPDAKHECYRSTAPLLEKYLDILLDFYAK